MTRLFFSQSRRDTPSEEKQKERYLISPLVPIETIDGVESGFGFLNRARIDGRCDLGETCTAEPLKSGLDDEPGERGT